MNNKMALERLRVACNKTSIDDTFIRRLRRFFVDTQFSYSITTRERKEIEEDTKEEDITSDKILSFLSEASSIHSELKSILISAELRKGRRHYE